MLNRRTFIQAILSLATFKRRETPTLPHTVVLDEISDIEYFKRKSDFKKVSLMEDALKIYRVGRGTPAP